MTKLQAWKSVFVLAPFIAGCSAEDAIPVPPLAWIAAPDSETVVQNRKNNNFTIHAQGRLQPTKGIAQLGGVPGDQVIAMLVAPGDQVSEGQVLATLKSEQLKQIELEIAELKLAEASVVQETKLRELEMAVRGAELKKIAADQMVEMAATQLNAANQSALQVDHGRKQLENLQALHDDPLTKAVVGSNELKQKEMELENLVLASEQAKLGASQQVKQAELQRSQAEKGLEATRLTLNQTKNDSPLRSLNRQVDLLRLQLKATAVVSPYPATVLSTPSMQGARVGALPIVEVADLSSMVCVAEVYEADVGKLHVGDEARITSSALRSPVTGKVSRIDRVVGASQLRSPNPMARTDFRTVSVWIEIPLEQAAIAAERIQLQDDVTIVPSR